jgi:hypothetical protein
MPHSLPKVRPGRFKLSVALAATIAAAAALFAVPPQGAVTKQGDLPQTTFRDRPALLLTNDRVELTVLPMGGAFAAIVLKDDAEKMNPLWDALRADQEEGRPLRPYSVLGHFVCVDGFGPSSAEERATGFPGHGEAHTLPWATRSFAKEGKVASLVQAVHLPRVQEVLTRTLKLVDGENIVYVRSTLESLVGFDRPVNWAEHATIGSPFLEPGVTVVDMSSNRALTRPHDGGNRRVPYRLPSEKEFAWPMAPTLAGGLVDLRAAPNPPNSGDHTGHLMDATRPFAFVTALHPQKRLLLGYLFKRSESPWLQIWESYPPKGMMARGLEFGTQAFDLPRREVVTQNRLFGELLYRWLPAKSTIESSYLFFWTRVPEGFLGVSDIEFSGGALRIEDKRSGQTLTLPASLPL